MPKETRVILLGLMFIATTSAISTYIATNHLYHYLSKELASFVGNPHWFY